MAFFAIPIPSPLKAQLATVLAALKQPFPSVQWVHPEDYHLTLRFLGGLQHEALLPLLQEFRERSLPFTRFSLKLRGVSTFPPQRGRGVLWIAPEAIPPELKDLQRRLEERVQALGFAAEPRAFTPHVTIARFMDADAVSLGDALADMTDRIRGEFTCHEYVLMKRRSGLAPHAVGPLYEALLRFPG